MRAVTDQGRSPRGVLAIGANEATCLYVLPRAFEEYRRLYPEVQITIYRNFSRKILERIQDGLIDVGIVTLPVKLPRLKVERIFRDRLMLATSPANPLAKLKAVPVRVAAEQPLIFPKAGYTRQIMDKLFRPYRADLKIAMELPSIAMIKTFVASGLGVSLISETFTRKEVRAAEICLVRLEHAELWRELGMVHDRNRTLPRAAVAFMELVRSGVLAPESKPVRPISD